MSANSNNNLVNLLKKVAQQDPENSLLAELRVRHSEGSIEDLVTDLREDASNTLGRIITGAVDYDECVKRVAIKVGVNENHLTDDETQNELLILQASLKSYFEKLSPEEREKKLEEISIEFAEQLDKDTIRSVFLGSTTALLTIIQSGGVWLFFQIFIRFLGFQVAYTAARFAALVIPFLNVVMVAWLVFDISGPAYRKIIPSVLNIALLRLSYSEKAVANCG